MRPHGARRTDELVDRLALHAERDEERPDLRRGRVPAEDALHCRGHLGLGEILPVGDARDGLPERHAVPPRVSSRARKFASSRFPSTVRIDSG